MIRTDGRGPGALRPTQIDLDTVPYAEGSCTISTGNTRVLCAASVLDEVPDWRAASGKGWVTGEYGMLPRATHTRGSRERRGPKGRTQEIQRLIGRSLRSVTDLGALGPRTIVLDCDVLQADGGTRTASITGAAVALYRAGQWLVQEGEAVRNPMRELVAGVSVGLLEGNPILDLDYHEDSRAQVDLNLVVTEGSKLVEVQGTAEGDPFSMEELRELLDLGMEGISSLIGAQITALGI
ncbi:MAG: ribonuclease PH [Gemmatimonadetes bacterium]|nr:ribonuclease PH [Gemmatimonadota bacterium]NNM05012.1 ribonuclease PH [Gemmatimonadota bacterium]